MMARRKFDGAAAAAVLLGSLLMEWNGVWACRLWMAAFYRSHPFAPGRPARRSGRFEALAYCLEPLAVRAKVLAAQAGSRTHVDHAGRFVEQEFDVVDKLQQPGLE